MNKLMWPYNAQSREPDTTISWLDADPVALEEVANGFWKKVALVDLQRLMKDPRNEVRRESLSVETVACINRLIGGGEQRPVDRPGRRTPEEVLAMIEREIANAQNENDTNGALKGIELLGKAQALFNVKEMDPVITIQVVTGVERGPKAS